MDDKADSKPTEAPTVWVRSILNPSIRPGLIEKRVEEAVERRVQEVERKIQEEVERRIQEEVERQTEELVSRVQQVEEAWVRLEDQLAQVRAAMLSQQQPLVAAPQP